MRSSWREIYRRIYGECHTNSPVKISLTESLLPDNDPLYDDFHQAAVCANATKIYQAPGIVKAFTEEELAETIDKQPENPKSVRV